MKILSTKFIKGVVDEEAILYDGIPQIAFIGRSNVGKSSTLNALFGTKKMVKTGKTPGKTKEINFFEVYAELSSNQEAQLYFVDLPGYGYAKLSKKDRQKLSEMIHWYITHPAADTALICVIIDSQVGITDLDREMIDAMKHAGKSYMIGINKIDKINQKAQSALIKEIEKEYGKNTFIVYSAKKNKNIYKVLAYIEQILLS